MKKQSIRFLGILLITLLFVFGIHLLSLDSFGFPLFANKIILAYSINYILATIILLLVERSMQPKSAQGGFIFFAGSALKFAVFFLIFYPSYKADGELQNIEFVTFFVPYFVSLLLEVFYLSKQLNNQ